MDVLANSLALMTYWAGLVYFYYRNRSLVLTFPPLSQRDYTTVNPSHH